VGAFVQGPDRELYVLDIDGYVYRLDPAPAAATAPASSTPGS
jgi:hypothetical protein